MAIFAVGGGAMMGLAGVDRSGSSPGGVIAAVLLFFAAFIVIFGFFMMIVSSFMAALHAELAGRDDLAETFG